MSILDFNVADRFPLLRAARHAVMAATLAVAAVAATPASAVTITTTHFTGDVLFAAENNPFGLLLGDTISGFVTIDTDLFSFPVDQSIPIDSTPNSELSISVGAFTLGAKVLGDGTVVFDDDVETGFPLVTFTNGKLTGIDFLVEGNRGNGDREGGGFGNFPNLVFDSTPGVALNDPNGQGNLPPIDWKIFDKDTGEDILAGIFDLPQDIGAQPNNDNGNSVPEPGALALMALGLAGLGTIRRRRKA